MSEKPIQVVIAYDLSPSSEIALSRAIEVVARAPQHVLHVITVLEHRIGTSKVSYESAAKMQQTVRDHIAGAFQDRESASEVQFFVHARIGKPAVEILALAREVGADLLFIGSHNKVGLERYLLGSVSERIVREAQCPVMVVRPKTYADVDLLRVILYEHERPDYTPPHRYSYIETRLIARPPDWPLN
jgi:nucleotide-binding universal stress UspA family protein